MMVPSLNASLNLKMKAKMTASAFFGTCLYMLYLVSLTFGFGLGIIHRCLGRFCFLST
jgi:hypothetical protein